MRGPAACGVVRAGQAGRAAGDAAVDPPPPPGGPVMAVAGRLLVAEELEKEYRTGAEVVRVLRGVNLTLQAGEVVALVGASGIGKTTLLYILGALDRPTAGRVRFGGEDLFAPSEAGLARVRRQRIGFVFQFYNPLGDAPALAHPTLPALLPRKSAPS